MNMTWRIINGIFSLAIVLLLSACGTAITVPSDDAGIEQAIPVNPMVVPPITEKRRSENPAVVALLAEAKQADNRGDISSAIAQVERALRIDSRNPAAYYQMASYRLKDGKAAEAIQLANKALHFEPDSSTLVVKLWELVALCHEAMGNPDAALRARKKAESLR